MSYDLGPSMALVSTAFEGLVSCEADVFEMKGEAGLHHYAAGASDLAFESKAAVRAWLFETAQEEGVPAIRFVVNIRRGARLQGQYQPRFNQIRCQPHLHLRTIIHEMAHHVTCAHYGPSASSHGRHYKKVLEMIWRRTYVRLGRDVPPRKRRVRWLRRTALPQLPELLRRLDLRPKPGTRVRIRRQRATDIVGPIMRYGRTKALVKNERDGREWHVPVAQMEVIR